MVVDYLIVAAIGGLVGIAELITRYRDAPGAALWSMSAGIYVGLNAMASVAALGAINVFGWTFGIDPSNAAAVRWTQVFVAGFGSMVLFRSSLFVVRVGSSDIAVGPGGFLQIFLETADRAVDRGRARPRANAAATIMAGVSFSRAAEPLPAYCFALLQNVAAEEQKQFGMQVLGLQAAVRSAARTGRSHNCSDSRS